MRWGAGSLGACPARRRTALPPRCLPLNLITGVLQPGIAFQDVTTILLDPAAFKHTIEMLVERYRSMEVDVVAGDCGGAPVNTCCSTFCVNSTPASAGFEARGLIFGAPLAIALGCAFVPLRKPGKLPGELLIAALLSPFISHDTCFIGSPSA